MSQVFRPAAFFAFVALATIAPTDGSASDGLLEINSTCATVSGCFPGDAAGYPVTIDGTAGRSFRLTSPLIVNDANTTAILVTASDVTIDLAGFLVSRVNCAFTALPIPGVCPSTTGSGSGIRVDDFTNRRGVRVRDGSVVGFGDGGILLGPSAEAHGVVVRLNRTSGLSVGRSSTVRLVRSRANGGTGIVAGEGSVVSESVSLENGGAGVLVQPGSRVHRNIVWSNGAEGVRGTTGVTVDENSVGNNATNPLLAVPGISVSAGTVTGNTVYGHNDNPGIRATSGSRVEANVVMDTIGFGAVLSSDSAYGENVFIGNLSGSVSSGHNVGSNACNGALCP